MEGRVLMTAGAGAGRPFEDIVKMAFFAGHVGMFAIQFESREIMVKGGRLPALGGVAGAAILPEFAVVVIVFLVTGKTGAGSAFEDAIEMAIRTFYFGVFAFQLEGRAIVVKCGGLPGGGFVAGAAIFSKLALMCIVFLVTGSAINRRGFEIGSSLCIQVTFFAGWPAVFAFEFEDRPTVVKFLSEGFKTIVTAAAVCPVR